MSKKRRKPVKASRKKAVTTPVEPAKRDTLKLLRMGALGAVAVGGAGFFSVRGVRATAAEHDLTQLGGGRPTVVQIHDPQCPTCTALQRQTRKALRSFDEDQIGYLVANIKTVEGATFARRYGVPHVTLLLFDGQGRLETTLSGPHQADALRLAFQDHLDTVTAR
ncbi:MAG: TlpA family protein disulfide reductase [Sedimentitalea sp.]